MYVEGCGVAEPSDCDFGMILSVALEEEMRTSASCSRRAHDTKPSRRGIYLSEKIVLLSAARPHCQTKSKLTPLPSSPLYSQPPRCSSRLTS